MNPLARLFLCAVVVLVAASPAFASAFVIAEVNYSGGMPIPGAPTSSGITVLSNGRVVAYKHYTNCARDTAVVTMRLDRAHIDKILLAAASLTSSELVRDTSAPQCADAPYQLIKVLNARGEMIAIADKLNCVPGHRPDWAAMAEAQLLESLTTVAIYPTW